MRVQANSGMLLEQSEHELVESCRRGDRDAFRALFERHKDKVYSIALRYSGDETAAMDIAQDTFLKLFSSISSFRAQSSFETWLYRMVVNRCLDCRRREWRWRPLLEEFAAVLRTPETSAVEELLRSERDRQVQDAVAALAPDLRIAVVLRYTEGLSYEQISEVLGCPAGTVASRLNRAHGILGRRLAHLTGGPRG
jgi:RNA polymerase sigma-70 factor (ECF subfamily)